MEKIRDYSPTVKEQGAELHVGRQTAIMSDLSQKLDDALIPYLIVVVGLAFLIMIGVFRSLWVPLIATVGFYSVLGYILMTYDTPIDAAVTAEMAERPLLGS